MEKKINRTLDVWTKVTNLCLSLPYDPHGNAGADVAYSGQPWIQKPSLILLLRQRISKSYTGPLNHLIRYACRSADYDTQTDAGEDILKRTPQWLEWQEGSRGGPTMLFPWPGSYPFPSHCIGRYGLPEANSTFPFDHRTASANSSSHSDEGLERGNMIGLGFSDAIRETTFSVKAF